MEPDIVALDTATEPEVRVQEVNGDTILEVSEQVIRKQRFSNNDLLRQKAYFEEMIAKGTAGLADVEAKLSQIHARKDAR